MSVIVKNPQRCNRVCYERLKNSWWVQNAKNNFNESLYFFWIFFQPIENLKCMFFGLAVILVAHQPAGIPFFLHAILASAVKCPQSVLHHQYQSVQRSVLQIRLLIQAPYPPELATIVPRQLVVPQHSLDVVTNNFDSWLTASIQNFLSRFPKLIMSVAIKCFRPYDKEALKNIMEWWETIVFVIESRKTSDVLNYNIELTVLDVHHHRIQFAHRCAVFLLGQWLAAVLFSNSLAATTILQKEVVRNLISHSVQLVAVLQCASSGLLLMSVEYSIQRCRNVARAVKRNKKKKKFCKLRCRCAVALGRIARVIFSCQDLWLTSDIRYKLPIKKCNLLN